MTSIAVGEEVSWWRSDSEMLHVAGLLASALKFQKVWLLA